MILPTIISGLVSGLVVALLAGGLFVVWARRAIARARAEALHSTVRETRVLSSRIADLEARSGATPDRDPS